ncbi:MAG: hypothetical protein U9Q22_05570 [Candidatus Altiarchaeota archaeon]|nr:hypothetical protein [Candidatus Altiarchaeota archaeon]
MEKSKILKITILLFILVIVFISGYLYGAFNSYKKCLIEYNYDGGGFQVDYGLSPYFYGHFFDYITREPSTRPESNFYAEDKFEIVDWRLSENGELTLQLRNNEDKEMIIPADGFKTSLMVVNSKRADIECGRPNSDTILKPKGDKVVTFSCGNPEEKYVRGSRYFVAIEIEVNESNSGRGGIWSHVASC